MKTGSFGMVTVAEDGEPCGHFYCGGDDYPCENCGRIGAQGEFKLPSSMCTPRKEDHDCHDIRS